jgi:hypothetical protein
MFHEHPTNSTDVKIHDRKSAAKFLRLTPGSLANLHGEGRGPVYYKRGKMLYYLESDLIAWIMAGKIDPRSK